MSWIFFIAFPRVLRVPILPAEPSFFLSCGLRHRPLFAAGVGFQFHLTSPASGGLQAPCAIFAAGDGPHFLCRKGWSTPLLFFPPFEENNEFLIFFSLIFLTGICVEYRSGLSFYYTRTEATALLWKMQWDYGLRPQDLLQTPDFSI